MTTTPPRRPASGRDKPQYRRPRSGWERKPAQQRTKPDRAPALDPTRLSPREEILAIHDAELEAKVHVDVEAKVEAEETDLSGVYCF